MNQNQVTRISAVEAKKMMEESTEYLLLDVRTQQEYDQGHIQGAQLLPYDEVEQHAQDRFQNRDALIFVYCHSGRRSLQAAYDLAELGYSNVYEFGGILSWPFGTVCSQTPSCSNTFAADPSAGEGASNSQVFQQHGARG